MTTDILRRRENWDFGWITRRGAFPAESLRQCFLYEIGRHIPHFIQRVAKSKKEQTSTSCTIIETLEIKDLTSLFPVSFALGVLDSLSSAVAGAIVSFKGLSISVPPDYPLIPYRDFMGDAPKEPKSDDVKWLEMLAPRSGYQAWRHLDDIMDSFRDFDPGDQDESFPPESIEAFHRMVLLQIPRGFSKATLRQAFDRYLDHHFEKHPEFKKDSGKDPHNQYKGLLNQLGAWRLLKSGFTLEKAKDFSQANSLKKKAIYENDPEWSRAKRAITEILRRHFDTQNPI